MNGRRELHGTGLHNRADWPLPVSSTPDSESSLEKVGKPFGQHARAELEQDLGAEQTFRLTSCADIRPSTISSCYDIQEYDVSDVEEDDQDLPRPQSTAQSSVSQSRSSASAPPEHHQQPEVSPVRAEHDSATSVSPDTTAEDEAVQHEHLEEHGSSRHSGIEELKSFGEQETETEDEEESVEDEARDIARPLSFATSSPALLQGTASHTSSPRLSGDASSSNHASPAPNENGFEPKSSNRSSIAKEPMHAGGNRRSSARNSIYNTTQLPYQKDRVRWSWQSIQDEEPNRPRIYVIKLYSQTVTSSAGFPTGEAFRFSVSPGGRRIAAYNSARLYVLQTNALPVGISRDYSLKRRPLDVQLTDEGDIMAVLADDHTVNIYELGHQLLRTKTVKLDFPTHCIALAPTGGLLATAYEGGTEVFSLDPDATPTDRRAVRSVKMDRLMFSEDGSTLLGTTTRINAASVMVCSVPVFPETPDGLPTHEDLRKAWCSDLLHPENIRNSSHATFMRVNRRMTNEKLFAWNGLEDTFGILSSPDMQYGNVDFPVVISPPLSTVGGLGAAIHSCPSIDEHGDTVAMIVNDRTIRLYIIPQTTGDDASPVEAHSIDHELDEGYGCPFSEVRWVHSSAALPAPTAVSSRAQARGRLIVTSPGGVSDPGVGEESVEDIEGGRLILFDFDSQFAGQPGQTFSLTFGKSPTQTLDEEELDVTEQVDLVRRRTVTQSKSAALNQRPPALGRSATTYGLRGSAPGHRSNVRAHRDRTSMLSIGSMQSEAAHSLPDLTEANEMTEEGLEEPYVQGAPRSHASLQRAATNAQRHRFQALEERNQERGSVDSSGGFLALPEYTEEPNAPLPSRFRAMAGLDAPTPFNRPRPSLITTVNGTTVTASPSSSTPQTAPPDVGEGFSADMAFQAARANMAAQPQQQSVDRLRRVDSISVASPTSGASTPSSIPSSLQRQGTLRGTNNYEFSQPNAAPPQTGNYSPAINGPQTVAPFAPRAIAAMPRSLQRAYSNAYSNAVSPIGTGPPPSLIGDWHNVSPIVSYQSAVSTVQTSTTGHIGDEDTISPVNAPSMHNVPFGHAAPVTSYRHSTSLLDPPGHMPPHRPQTSDASIATSPVGPVSVVTTSDSRHMPPHIEQFRNAAAASASLFPPTQPRDHVPVRQNTVRAGAVAHPITAWHPPAPSTIPPRSNGFSNVRKASFRGKAAFASTQKARNLGFFRRSRSGTDFSDPGPDASEVIGNGVGKEDDARSIVTWATKNGRNCSIM